MASLAEMFGAGAEAAATFMGLPRADLAAPAADVVILGADGCTPYGSVGHYCAGGPAAIRAAAAAYAANLGHMNFDIGGPVEGLGDRRLRIADAGDVPVSATDGAANRAVLAQAVGQVLDAGAVPVLIGGDDSLPIPMLQAYAARGRRIVILQVDAHIDWRDEVQGERWGLSSTMRRASEMAGIERIVQVGQRGIGSARMADVADARAWGVEFVSGREVQQGGLARAIGLIPEGSEVVICLDWDALDPAIMPAVIGRTAGGLSFGQALDLIEGVAGRARIAGLALTEFMPAQDIGGMGAMTAAQLVAAALGMIGRRP
jgi:agmatinase